MNKLNILKIIIDVLWFFVASINAGLHFLFNKMKYFKNFLPDFKGQNIDIQFTFDYRVFAASRY